MPSTSHRRPGSASQFSTLAFDEFVTPVPCLATRIRARIEGRLGDRIRDLQVSVDNKRVRLSGSCATYYSKQLAQHAALGVLEDEQLENDIIVGL